MYFVFVFIFIHVFFFLLSFDSSFVFLWFKRGAQPDKKIATRQVQRLKSPLLWIEISTDHTLKVKGYEVN